jgi:ubiquinone/menaquinone biosynthesis C-methylase UbiE
MISNNEISRVTRSKQAARQAYNRLSRWYDLLAGASEQRFMKIGLTQLHPQVGEKILEIGCGTGHALTLLAKAVSPSGSIFGFDISEGMLARAQRQFNKSVTSFPITFQLGDASRLPYCTGYFSAIFMCFTLELFDTPDISHVLSECRRALEKNGRIGIVCLAKGPGWPVRTYEWFHKKFPIVIDCRQIYVQQFLSQSGFEIIASESGKMWGLPVNVVTAKITQMKLES